MFFKAFCVEIAQAFRCPKQKGLEKENPAVWCHIFSGVFWLPSGQLPQWLKTQSFCISSFLVWKWFVNCNKWRHPWSSLVRALLEAMGGVLGAGWKAEQLITAPFFSEKHRRENTHRVDTLQERTTANQGGGRASRTYALWSQASRSVSFTDGPWGAPSGTQKIFVKWLNQWTPFPSSQFFKR